jgi:hypothetical protein
MLITGARQKASPSRQSRSSQSEFAAASGNDHSAYAAIALFVALSYVLTVGPYVNYLNSVLPHGDWFTYTINWFADIDLYRKQGYWLTLATMLAHPGNWYRLMNIGVAALAPILAKQPYVICIVNYLLFGFATAAFYRLGRRMGLTAWTAFGCALIPWLWPVNYGFADYSSLPVTALDAAFNAALFWAVAQAYIFAFDLQNAGSPAVLRSDTASAASRRHLFWPAILTGLVIGIAIWGRGNSLPVVGLVASWPALLALWFAWRSRDPAAWIAVAIAGAVAALMAAEFYAQYWRPLLNYYGVHASYVEAHRWSFAGARQFILNVPGFMFWRAEDSLACVGLTFASHLFALLTLVIAWWPGGPFSTTSHFRFRQLAAGGAVIYFGTYLADLAMFANDQPGFSIYQSLLVWRPMLIGLSLMLVALATEVFDRFGPRLDRLIPIGLTALALAWGFIWTHINTPWDPKHSWPSPRSVERFALSLDRLADHGPVAVLWYRGWNEPILNYYRLKNDLPTADLFTGAHLKYQRLIATAPPSNLLTIVRHPLVYYRRRLSDWEAAKKFGAEHHDAMWSMADYSDEKRARVLEEIEYQFTHASLIVLPEYLDQYRPVEPYAFYKFKDDWAAWLNSDKAPRFRVLMLLQETPRQRLLVIRRDDLVPGQGDPLRLPYGERAASSPPDYSDAVIRFR